MSSVMFLVQALEGRGPAWLARQVMVTPDRSWSEVGT
jgi:hypothetical protein